MKKHYSKSIIALLLFVVILLTGCQTSTYPETIADMTKLWENNKTAFDEFAQMILENVPDDKSTLMLSYNQPPGKWSYFYDDGEDLSPELIELSALINADKIKSFIDKYSVYQVIADQEQVAIDVYKMSLADQPGHGSEYPSANLKFVRTFTYAVEERYTPDKEGYLNEHWLAERPHADVKVDEGFGTLTYSVNSLKDKGYTFVEPEIKQITELPFLYQDKETWQDNRSIPRNHPVDYFYELDDEHLFMIYEKDRELKATIYNWKSQTEVESVARDLHGGLIGNYHVERLNDNTFAYAAGMPKNEGAETLSLITIEENEINVETVGVLPVAGQWTKKGVSINSTLDEIAYIDEVENQIVWIWGDWYMVNGILDMKSWSSEELGIDTLGRLEQLHLVSQYTLVYTWGGVAEDTNRKIAGFGVIDLKEKQIIDTQRNAGVSLTPTKYGVLLGGANHSYGLELYGEDFDDIDLPKYYERRNHYITEVNISSFGSFEFSGNNRQFLPGNHAQYVAIHVAGNKYSHVKDFYIAWYDYTMDTWEQEVWVIEDTAIFLGARVNEMIRPDATYCIGDTNKRIYALGFGDKGKTVLNVIE